MNKKIGLLFVVSFICFFLCGCNKNVMTEEHIFKISSENDCDYITDLFQIDRECENIICILDDNIVYSRYENKSKELVFYKYNINEDLAYYLGKIKGPYISSGDEVAVDNSIFFYHTEFDIASGNVDEKLEHSLYQIDIEKNTLQKMGSDSAEQPLVYLDELNGNIISLKGKRIKNQGWRSPFPQLFAFASTTLQNTIFS